jgi:hypothetical protein
LKLAGAPPSFGELEAMTGKGGSVSEPAGSSPPPLPE